MTGGPREIFDCERVRAYLDSFLEGQVPPPEARAIRLHFLRCEACYGRIVGREPLQLFAPLALDEDSHDEAFWNDLWPAVRAGIRETQPRRHGIMAFLRGPTLAWSAAAALLVVAVLAFVH
ncbi:MAG TPA: zf-HC2 domain-containing protein, partial [Candidatus Saccharimonadales bacterium]|nr:zf-HC2 domain-containing protein [Candidatus Saccharimonadales bacterium]